MAWCGGSGVGWRRVAVLVLLAAAGCGGGNATADGGALGNAMTGEAGSGGGDDATGGGATGGGATGGGTTGGEPPPPGPFCTADRRTGDRSRSGETS